MESSCFLSCLRRKFSTEASLYDCELEDIIGFGKTVSEHRIQQGFVEVTNILAYFMTTSHIIFCKYCNNYFCKIFLTVFKGVTEENA